MERVGCQSDPCGKRRAGTLQRGGRGFDVRLWWVGNEIDLLDLNNIVVSRGVAVLQGGLSRDIEFVVDDDALVAVGAKEAEAGRARREEGDDS